MKKKEWIPDFESDNWEFVNDFVYSYSNIPSIEYKITKSYINTIKKLKKIEKEIVDDDNEYKIYKIFEIIYNDKKIISSTQYTIEYIIKMNIYYDKHEKMFGVNDGMTYKMLGCYKINGNIKKEINKLKEKFEDKKDIKDIKKKKTNINIFEEYKKQLENDVSEKETYYIQKITDGKKSFYLCSNKKIKSNDIKNIVSKNNIDFGDSKLKILLVKTIKSTYLLSLFDTDLLINNDKNCLNKYLYIVKKYTTLNDIIIDVQMMMLYNKINNEYDDEEISGFVGKINIGTKYYIVSGYKNSIKNLLLELCSLRNYTTNNKLLLEELRLNGIDDVEILEENIEYNELEHKKLYYINVFYGENLLNMQMDYVSAIEFNKIIKATESKIWMSRRH